MWYEVTLANGNTKSQTFRKNVLYKSPFKKSLIYQLFEANSFYHFFSNGFNISIKILVENI